MISPTPTTYAGRVLLALARDPGATVEAPGQRRVSAKGKNLIKTWSQP